MVYLILVLAVIALVIAILAYQKAGGMTDLRKQIEQVASSSELRKSVDSLASATESLKEKTAETIGKIETAFRRAPKEEKKPAKRSAAKRPVRRTGAATRRPATRPSIEKPESPSPEKTEESA
jgi:hypothetical protein